jgi:ribosomal peptide maturation radical SAM protein 1
MMLLRYLKIQTLDNIAATWAANDFAFTREFEDQPSAEQLQVLTRLAQDTQDCLAGFPKAVCSPDPFIAKMMRLRQDAIPQFLDDLMAEIDLSGYSLVGFSCLFDQTIASLALARRVRRKHPSIMIAFGGYALQPPVGPALQQCFPEMDVVAYGDGEPVIVPLWEASCGMRSLDEVPNISYRSHDGKLTHNCSLVRVDLDDSPTPDYDDFFIQREELKQKHRVSFVIGEVHAESSRGCWYGQKSHCTFCGIDDETLRYRTKTPQTLVAQLDELHKRYNVSVFRFSDYIMPLSYLHDCLPEMATRGAPYQLHYETKANLKAKQIELCAHAGVRFLQPGIESFSTPVLKLMAKGVSAAQNIFALYTMLLHGIYSFYNIIFGFPFETVEDYEEMIEIIPALYHLIPPETTIPVLVTRYAPLAAEPERFGASAPLKAHWRYDVIFSREFRKANGILMEDVCYYYESPYREFEPDLKVAHDVLQHQVVKWKERHASGNARLTYRKEGECLVVQDTRWEDVPETYRFAETHDKIGGILREGVLARPRLLQELRNRGIGVRKGENAIEELIRARVVLSVESHLVWLAHPEGSFERTHENLHRTNSDVLSSSEWQPWERPSAVQLRGASQSRDERPLITLQPHP